MLIDNKSLGKDPRYQNVQKDNPMHEPPNLSLLTLERMYERCADLFDKKFKSQIKSDFCACYAELYFAATLRVRFNLNVVHKADNGPDFFLPEQSMHCEVTAITNGKSGDKNSIPAFQAGISYTHPERQIILRITNAFSEKSKKIKNDILKGLVEDNESVVIVISANGISDRIPMYYEDSFPEVVKALLPVADPIYWINPKTGKQVSKEYKWNSFVKKVRNNDEINISTESFLSEEHSHISAVVYSWHCVFDATTDDCLGNDFFILHNPLAKNPIKKGLFFSGVEFVVESVEDGFTIKKVDYAR